MVIIVHQIQGQILLIYLRAVHDNALVVYFRGHIDWESERSFQSVRFVDSDLEGFLSEQIGLAL